MTLEKSSPCKVNLVLGALLTTPELFTLVVMALVLQFL